MARVAKAFDGWDCRLSLRESSVAYAAFAERKATLCEGNSNGACVTNPKRTYAPPLRGQEVFASRRFEVSPGSVALDFARSVFLRGWFSIANQASHGGSSIVNRMDLGRPIVTV